MKKETHEWLETFKSRNSAFGSGHLSFNENKKTPQVISIASGKGGVGKTTLAVHLGLQLSQHFGLKVLLIDCDYNLSNTVLKLDLPLSNNFIDLILCEKDFFQAVHQLGNLHILGGCSGNKDLFEKTLALDRFVTDIIDEYGHFYDWIILDCPGGLSKEVLHLNAFSDFRFVVVMPDKASITDSYSLIKLLKLSFGIQQNHILINRSDSEGQAQKIFRNLKDTTNKYLDANLHLLGAIADIRGLDKLQERKGEHTENIELAESLRKLWDNFFKQNKIIESRVPLQNARGDVYLK